MNGRKWGALAGVTDDARQAVRALARRPVFSLFAAGTVALGVGATTAIFSALETVILNPLPYEGADRIVGLWGAFGTGNSVLVNPREAQVEAWRRQDDLFEAVEPIQKEYPSLTGLGDAARVETALVRPSYFDFLGVRPVLGRLFTGEETVGDGASVALVGHHLWKDRFGGEASALGRTVTLDGETLTVIGVLPPRLPPPTGMSRRIDIYRPLAEAGSVDRSMVVARLGDGVGVEEVQARLDLLAERAAEEGPPALAGRATVRRTAELVGRAVEENLRVLMAAVVLLLLIACVNVSNLLLCRATRRQHETAVRSALGAGRGRLFREQLLESLLLGLAGGGVGVALAYGAVRGMASVRGDALDVLGAVHINGRVLVFALLLSVLSAVVFGVLPAMRAGWSAPARGLAAARGADGRGRREGRARWMLLVSEVALSFALLVGGTLVLRSLAEMRSRDPGFEAEGLVALRVSLPTWKYEEDGWKEVHERIGAAVGRLPWVDATVRTSGVPPSSGIFTGSLEVEGGPEVEGTQMLFGSSVEPGYFGLLGQRILEGRDFTEEEHRDAAPVVVLGEGAARRLFPDREAVGGRIKQGGGEWRTVVGVVEDVAHQGLSSPKPDLQLYRPLSFDGAWVIARYDGPIAEVMGAIRGEVLGAEPDAAVMELAPVDGMLAATLGRERFTTALLGAFAVLALLLSAVGLYGVVSQVVGQRTREIGIRMALGAGAGRVRGVVLGQGLLATGGGVLGGTGLVIAGLRLLESRVFGIESAGPGTYGLAAAVLACVALLACWVPARRAAAVQPAEALRRE